MQLPFLTDTYLPILQDMKELLKNAEIPVPLLSPARHDLCYSEMADQHGERICGAYKEQVNSECNPQNKYNSTIFINPKIFVDVDGTHL